MGPGTGRVVPVPMYGLAQGEIEAATTASGFVARLFESEEPAQGRLDDAPDLRDYVNLALRGGFPEVVGMTDELRLYWYPGYVDQLVHRDVASMAQIRAPERLAAMLHAVAASTGGMPTLTKLLEAVKVDGRTARSYLDLLVDLRICERVPAWHTNRLQRLVKAPKLYITDSGLAAHLLNVDASALLKNGDLLGRMIDTFVTLQLLPLVALSAPRVQIFHLRDANDEHEVDLILEGTGGRVVGLEIKARASASQRDARHLAWLRDKLGDAFHRGVVFHTGDVTYPLGDRIWAMPIATIWR
jgi:predicted AAA+ superfamily ATPase